MSSDYFSTLPEAEQSHYLNKLGLIGQPSCPFSVPPSKWINDLTQWLEIAYPDIYTYLIESPGSISVVSTLPAH